ncbi:SWIM zinc finger family protein, partial [Pseudomonas sp.]
MSRDALQLLREYPNWTQSFTGPVLQRGERYAREDRVEVEHCSGPLIEATCRGSEGSRYRQKITLTALAGRCHVRGQCSCPVGQNCKHCAAVLLALSEPQAAAKHAGDALPANLQRWLKGLEQPAPETAEAQDKRGRMVCYQLRLTEEPGCALRVRKGMREEEG